MTRLNDEELFKTILEWMDRPSLMAPNENARELLGMIREAERGKGIHQHPDVDTRNTVSAPYANKVLEAVPWQKCPVCDGHGLVMYPPQLANGQHWSGTSTGPWPCECCHGGRAIPMAIANDAAIQNAMKREGVK